MNVIICGPNLPKPLSERATFHVHKEGCRDLKRGPLGEYMRRYEGLCALEDPYAALDRLDVEAYTYDFAASENPDYVLGDWQSEFHFAPCCDDLPTTSDLRALLETPTVFDEPRTEAAKPIAETGAIIGGVNISVEDAVWVLKMNGWTQTHKGKLLPPTTTTTTTTA